MSIGQAMDRVDGPLKVTGRATYAYEHAHSRQLYGFIVGATIGTGRISRMDTAAAAAAPGVQLVMTHQNAPAQGIPDPSARMEYWRAKPVLSGPNIHHYGEPVALVVARTFEEARAAAQLIRVEYARGRGHYDLAAAADTAHTPAAVLGGHPAHTAKGDFAAAFVSAAVTVDATYRTPYEFSMPMEPHACLAVPHGAELTVYVSTQVVDAARASIAATLQLDPARLQVVAPYVGGGFGSKLNLHAEAILAVAAALELHQPVKVALTRQQMFHLSGLRPASEQRLRLAADADGRLIAIAHQVIAHTSTKREYADPTAVATGSLYAAPHRLTTHRLVRLDLPPGEEVRAPGEATGLLALESAVDELAHALGLDPVELRLRNEPGADPERGVPFSDRRLVACLREGARRFAWERRSQQPAAQREGQWLIGYGMSAAIRGHLQGASTVRVRWAEDGTAVVQTDMTDIGTGTYTILTQVAAEALGLTPDRVRVELGRSDFPTSMGSAGSWGAGSVATATYRACRALLEEDDPEATATTPYQAQDPNYAGYSLHTYGAHFVEVGVDMDTAEVRVRRMLGVFDVGRVLNPRTARSQLIGAMTWGVGAALLEDGVVDQRTGGFATRDLASYLVPVHADVPAIEAVILDGYDDKANLLGAKGLGELGICGAGAAVANAVFNATGARVRDFPITLEKLLPALPAMEA
jgi:xanthine dehydrogenase YagR molybdenum-binding subunit